MTNKNILIDVPMPITTPRLILRPAMPGDGKALHEAKTETYETLAPWMPWAKPDASIEDDEAVVREAYAKFIRREDMMLIGFSRLNGEFVVATGLHRFDWATRRFEIGYWTRAKYQNQGYVTEAANALTRYAFCALNANAVDIQHAEGNEFSSRVPKKLGFEYESAMRFGTALPDGTPVTKHTYVRTNINKLPELEVTWS